MALILMEIPRWTLELLFFFVVFFETDEQFFSAIRLKRKLLVTYCIKYKWKINETQNNQYSIENGKWLLKSSETIAKWLPKIEKNREKKNK